MQCQRCHFENMPGQQRCFKCGSILEGEITILDVNPPRMASWKRPWRQLARYLQPNYNPQPEQKKPGRYEPDYSTRESIQGFLLSLIPGLGHLVLREKLRVALVVPAWIFAVATALWLIPSQWGWVALGVGAGIHAWLALDAGLLRHLDHAAQRLAAVVVGFIGFVLVYILATLILQPIHPRNGSAPSLGLARTFFEKANRDIPAENIYLGDTLRFSPWDPNAPIYRGTLIRHYALTVIFYDNREANLRDRGVRTIGQIIGLPEEWVALEDDHFIVNEQTLDPNQYPIPDWLKGKTLNPIRVPPEQLFVGTPYSSDQRFNPGWAQQVCLVDANDIDGRATMLWLPTRRRHRLTPPPHETPWQP